MEGGASSTSRGSRMCAGNCGAGLVPSCTAMLGLQTQVLPHIASAKSPQAVMGSLVKRFAVQQLGWVLERGEGAGL